MWQYSYKAKYCVGGWRGMEQQLSHSKPDDVVKLPRDGSSLGEQPTDCMNTSSSQNIGSVAAKQFVKTRQSFAVQVINATSDWLLLL